MPSSQAPISSSELANLWMTYQEKTMILRMLEHFIEHAGVEEKKLLQMHYSGTLENIDRLKSIFQQEGAVLPIGFTEGDIHKGVPKLFDHMFDNEKVKQYLVKGMKLSKKIEIELGEYLRQSFIEPPASHAGKATTSKAAPFSDKIMLYNTSLLSSFGLGSNAIGSAFSLRSDLPFKMAFLAKNIYSEGAKIMLENGWLEEPPQIEDRNELTK
ncbi:DUF3231 family protein [uncultured Metabacillus sp.]|uniref:DUF3231 family protein n=1 Tax=uncultured Metabacillus sp. TaxID=2860135 RepID=UPI002629936E|nr:DUF3231 family protein [uncultured Metabacillus sp.]